MRPFAAIRVLMGGSLVAGVLLLLIGDAVAGEPYVAQVGYDGFQTVEITGGEYYFEPAHIVVKVGIPVKLVVKKMSRIVPHDIVMDEPEAGIVFKIAFDRDGEEIFFIPKKTGTYPFYCDKKLLFLKSHREKGMEGTLEVVE